MTDRKCSQFSLGLDPSQNHCRENNVKVTCLRGRKSGYGCDREEHGSGLKEPAIKECKATFGDILWPGTQGSVLVFPRLVLDATFDCV